MDGWYESTIVKTIDLIKACSNLVVKFILLLIIFRIQINRGWFEYFRLLTYRYFQGSSLMEVAHIVDLTFRSFFLMSFHLRS